MKNYDVYIVGDKAYIYERGTVDSTGELPKTDPIHVMNEDEDWYVWCIENGAGAMDRDSVRVCRKTVTIPYSYIQDLCKVAQDLFDQYRKEGKCLGWGDLEIDKSGIIHTLRQSAAWKDEPTLYTIFQPIKWNGNRPNLSEMSCREHTVENFIIKLHGMADAIWELGFNLVFDDDFKFQIKGAFGLWNTEFAE